MIGIPPDLPVGDGLLPLVCPRLCRLLDHHQPSGLAARVIHADGIFQLTGGQLLLVHAALKDHHNLGILEWQLLIFKTATLADGFTGLLAPGLLRLGDDHGIGVAHHGNQDVYHHYGLKQMFNN
jgi:hypothetical protein